MSSSSSLCKCERVGGFLLKHMWSACSQSAHMLVSVCVYPRVCLCTLCLRSGEAAGRQLEFRNADSKPGEGCGGGPLWRLSAVELQQEHQEQEGHPPGWRHSAAGTTAQVSRREHAHPCGGHPAGVCLRGEEGGLGNKSCSASMFLFLFLCWCVTTGELQDCHSDRGHD